MEELPRWSSCLFMYKIFSFWFFAFVKSYNKKLILSPFSTLFFIVKHQGPILISTTKGTKHAAKESWRREENLHSTLRNHLHPLLQVIWEFLYFFQAFCYYKNSHTITSTYFSYTNYFYKIGKTKTIFQLYLFEGKY